MSIPLVDLHVKFVIDHTLRTVRADPDRHLSDIFGCAKIDPHAALFGQKLIDDIKEWITTIEIPVVLGFELDPTQIPGVSVNLESSSPEQVFMGDAGLEITRELPESERLVVVSAFPPKNLVTSTDGTFITVTLPDDFTQEQTELVLPGLHWRDKNGKEFNIGEDGLTPTIIALEGGTPLVKGDFSQLEVITPFNDQRIRQGSMWFGETALITVQGHSDRPEGLWLWAIVTWGLLKFRPLLSSTFGLDLSEPRSSDFAKSEELMGTNVWRRFITLSAKTLWTWDSAKQNDAVAFLQTIRAVGALTGGDDTEVC